MVRKDDSEPLKRADIENARRTLSADRISCGATAFEAATPRLDRWEVQV